MDRADAAAPVSGSAELPGRRDPADPASLQLRLDGFEGPIDVLLTLAREQKVDLGRISVLQLADQYLAFVAESADLSRSADYLVMAAWLVWLKSRLLVSVDDDAEEPPTAEEMAEMLRLRLQRLEAMQQAGATLMAAARLGVDRFPRGMTDDIADRVHARHVASLSDLLRSYAGVQMRRQGGALRISRSRLFSVREQAAYLRRVLGPGSGWRTLHDMVPIAAGTGLEVRSAIASLFAAILQLADDGEVELRQAGPFGAIELRSTGAGSGGLQQ